MATSETLRNSRHSFWQALIITLAIFLIGIFLGIAYEGNRLTEINDYYILSDILLMDSFALTKLTDINNVTDAINCNVLIDSNIQFADRIYSEAILLEKYEESGKLTNELNVTHRKYDLLRTLLWINFMSIPEECKKNISSVIYLYEYNTDDLIKRASNKVWSRILFDLKQEKGDLIILIPIAVDSDLTSLNSILQRFNIPSYPVLIIDNKHVVSQISSVDEIEKYFK
ncbi:MAG: hypothetical protein ABIH65_01250 [Nanoarchaeota archaeon]